ncbi:MAG: hypothetical protein K6E28_02780 [Eubacterium sp.]|nr:hypothetical protein [Eubacterium sp.]
MKEEEKFEDIETIAQYGTKSLEQMERHAAVSAGFHDYEQDSFADKQMIANLCTQYKVFFEDNPKFSKFLDEMNAYAELDPYEHNNYLKEMNYVTNLSSKIEEMHRLLDEQEKEFLVSEDNSDIEAYNKLSEQDKMKADREYVLKEETIDNRRRALLSFEAYFENIRRGNLKDMDGLSDDANDKIKEANKISGRTLIDFEDEQGRKCYYINSSGAALDTKIDREDLTFAENKLATLGDLTLKDVEMKNAPLFPHEPRMTDISQQFSGECYLYSALQDITRLYPEKIKDMIKDNDDGTCTVRFFAKSQKKTEGYGSETVYHPVYVRVDKIVPKFGFGYDRMANDCLWVNMIERAYAMSGLHETYDEPTNLPVDLNDEKYKDKPWKPSISAIEGGHEYNALETLLGPAGVPKEITKPTVTDINQENDKLQTALDKLEKVKYVDVKSADSITRHAFYTLYKKKGGDLPESEIQKMDEKKLIKLMEDKCSKGDNYEYFEDAYKVIKATAQKVIDMTADRQMTSFMMTCKLGVALSDSIEEFYPEADSDELKVADTAIRSVYSDIREGLLEAGFKAEIPETPLKDKFFNEIKDALDKGLPLSCGSNQEKTKYATTRHAYSLIGAFKSEDVPPKYFFRIKNPHTKLEYANGMEYKNENGELVGNWVNVKDGIFDMQLENFIADYKYVYKNGSKELEATPHRKVQGYDIITEGDVVKNEENTITAGRLTDIMKVSNDLYDAMVSTNSKHSKDSPEYKNLLEGIKQFRHNLASAYGRSHQDMQKLTEPLIDLVQKYEQHVDDQLLGASKRQTRRKAVCAEIRKTVRAMDKGLNPLHEYQKEYAWKLVDKYDDMNGIKDKSQINEVAERMFKNKAFRKVVNSTNITKMSKPDKGQMEQHLSKIETSLKGRGVDKGVDMATMKQKTGPIL